MSRAKRTSRLALVVMILTSALLAPGIIQSDEAVAKNTVDVNQSTKTITITVNVTVIGVNSATLATSWTKAFNSRWGKPEGYRYACWTVILKADIQPGSSMETGRHTVFVVDTRHGQKWRDGVVRPPNWKPDRDSVKAYWSDPSSHKGAVPHEFGHVLGVPDEYQDFVDGEGKTFSVPNPKKAPEYQWNDTKPKNGKVDRGEVSLKPGETPSLMADHTVGQVLPRHIKGIVEKHIDPDTLKCKWKGSVDYHTTLTSAAADVSGTQVFPLYMTLEFEEDENGVLSGRGDATAHYMAEFTASGCGAWEVATPESFPVLVSGNHTGDEMQLIVQSDGPMPALSFMATNCGGDSVNSSSPLFWWLEDPSYWPPTILTARGDDNVYQYDETGLYHEVYPVGGSFTNSDTTIIITVEPADDEGVPVG